MKIGTDGRTIPSSADWSFQDSKGSIYLLPEGLRLFVAGVDDDLKERGWGYDGRRSIIAKCLDIIEKQVGV